MFVKYIYVASGINGSVFIKRCSDRVVQLCMCTCILDFSVHFRLDSDLITYSIRRLFNCLSDNINTIMLLKFLQKFDNSTQTLYMCIYTNLHYPFLYFLQSKELLLVS